MSFSTSLKSDLICTHCSKILYKPVTIHCGCTICHEHVNNLPAQTSFFKCNTCLIEYDTNKLLLESRPNKIAQRMLDAERHLSDEEKMLKRSLDEYLIMWNQLSDECHRVKLKLDVEFHKHFDDIKHKIETRRDELKCKLDEICSEMLNQCNTFEQAYAQSFQRRIESLKTELHHKKDLNLERQMLIEKFREPSLTIDSLRVEKLSKEKKLSSLKQKLNEMCLIRENLRANHFKSTHGTFQFEKEIVFGQLYFCELTSPNLESKILSPHQVIDLIKLCEFSAQEKWRLMYRASVNGFSAQDFHARCDGKLNTLTICKAETTGYIFGGYVSMAWESHGPWKHDPQAFLFSLLNKENKPTKMCTNTSDGHNAIFCHTSYGPRFGNDLYIASNANTSRESYSNLGFAYKPPIEYIYESHEAKTFLAGSYKFQLSEIEVFTKE